MTVINKGGTCPLCRKQGTWNTLEHRRSHIPEVTMEKYERAFPKMSERLRIGFAFLHLLTNDHASGRCCRVR